MRMIKWVLINDMKTIMTPMYVDLRNLRYATAAKLTALDDTTAMLHNVVSQHIDSPKAPCALKVYVKASEM